MKRFSDYRRAWGAGLGWGVLVFALLTVQFSPNWWVFWRGVREAKTEVSSATESVLVDREIMSAYSARGFYVTRQAVDLAAKIDDPNHQIVRWRLLIPAIARALHLPAWVTLGLAHVGCLVLVGLLVGYGRREAVAAGRPAVEGVGFGLIAGATAPFFASMGFLGYYDSWLAVALVAAACARPRWVVLTACLLAPWIDERFVLGLPLALWVRRMLADEPAPSLMTWLRRELLLPVLLVGAYTLVRLGLGGSGGSQTVGEYLRRFVFGEEISAAQRLWGAWDGLRFGWVLVVAAVIGAWRLTGRGARIDAVVLVAGIVGTGLAGLFSALDMSRSMVLLLPVLPLGWRLLERAAWRPARWTMPFAAGGALLVPATHVVGPLLIPVEHVWSVPRQLLTAQNNVGVMYAQGQGVPVNGERGLRWLVRAAEAGNSDAQRNVGWMYEHGVGAPRNGPEAARWYRRAADAGFAQAHHDLSRLYDSGFGVPRDPALAMQWRRRAADMGLALAQNELGVAYATGAGVSRDSTEAVRWYRLAAKKGQPTAQFNLGVMLAKGEGVPQDLAQAARWLLLSAARGNAHAQHRLASMLDTGDGLARNPDEAVRFYRLAAEQGLAVAQNDLGALYASGKYVPRDPAAAVKWYGRAAQQGLAIAQLNLGAMYALGQGVPQNLIQAYRWMAQAAAGGAEGAPANLAEVARVMTPEERAEAERRFRESTSHGVP